MRGWALAFTIVALSDRAGAQSVETHMRNPALVAAGSAMVVIGAAGLVGSIVFVGPVLQGAKSQDACWGAKSCFESETVMGVAFIVASAVLAAGGIPLIVIGAKRDRVTVAVSPAGLAVRF